MKGDIASNLKCLLKVVINGFVVCMSKIEHINV